MDYDNPITDYWMKHYVSKHMCSLCGQSGKIDTTGKTTRAGVHVGRINYCICPNGQARRRAEEGPMDEPAQTEVNKARAEEVANDPEFEGLYIYQSERLVHKIAAAISAASAEKDAEIARLTADSTYMAKLLVRLRDKLININDHVEDEGDRVYFGSTNDADDFKEVVSTLDDFKWSVILDRSKGRDIYAEMRELRARAEAAEAEAAALRERLERVEQANG